MPELPEVETIRRGLAPLVEGEQITQLIVREKRFRIPIDKSIQNACFKPIQKVDRRGKYLLLKTSDDAGLMVHLGMSGRFYLLDPAIPPKKHDHVDLQLSNGKILRFHDPRRFGLMLWIEKQLDQHALLNHLGPEPFSEPFSVDYFARCLKTSKRPIKLAIMDAELVVGVGNIYANEALFQAGIRPERPAHSLTLKEIQRLHQAILDVLAQAIEQGGTTLKDFANAEGKPGYFQQKLFVYGRENLDCLKCSKLLKSLRMQNRATVYCVGCQG